MMWSMDWTQAKEILLAHKGWQTVAKETGLHFNSVRNYAIGKTIPRLDNAQKIIEYLSKHDRRSGVDRRSR